MADVRPFPALRYSPDVDLSLAVCPPFDVISPEQQRALHDRSPHNAVRIELAIPNGGDRYAAAATALDKWRSSGTLTKDHPPAYYLYDQRFSYGDRTYTRRILFARVRLEPWNAGVVLPHEQTFGAPKEDRLKLLRATNLQASPVFLIYRDRERSIESVLNASETPPAADFTTEDGQSHTLHLITNREATGALHQAFGAETLYVADGHHRYETLLGFRDEVRASRESWTGEEAANFAMVALASASDPGMLVLPIHRITAAGASWNDAQDRLGTLFNIERLDSIDVLTAALHNKGRHAWGLITSEEPSPLLLTIQDAAAVDGLLPQDRSPAWRALDYSMADHAIMRHALALTDDQMTDYHSVWFSEDANEAEREVQAGRARYAILLNPVPIATILDLAEEGERMPQKSTFFYPKVPTGLVFNPIED